MPTRRALLAEARRALEAAGIEAPRRNAEWLLTHVLGCSRAHLYAYPEEGVAAEAAAQVRQLVARRARHEPLQYLVGTADFCGLTLRVTPAVLIPRPETEEMVEAALGCVESCAAPRVLDAGTGSGCIALAIKKERPEAEVAACDVSLEALAVACDNAARLGLDVRFFQADVLDPEAALPGALDLLVSNPPYIPVQEAEAIAPVVRAHEPHLALFSGDDALRFYRALAVHARRLLRPAGHVVFETHADYGADVCDLLTRSGFSDATIRDDLAGRARIATARQPG